MCEGCAENVHEIRKARGSQWRLLRREKMQPNGVWELECGRGV